MRQNGANLLPSELMNWIERHTRNIGIIDMYKQGYTARQIADHHSIGHGTVLKVLHDAAAGGMVTMRPPGRRKGDGRHMQEQIVALKMRADGYTYQVIGDEIGVTRQRAHQIVTRAQTEEARRG